MKPTLEEFSAAVAAIHESAAVPDNWPHALQTVMRLVDATKGAIFEIDAESLTPLGITALNHDPAVQSAYMQYYNAIDCTWALGVGAAPHQPVTAYENFSRSERARSEYFEFSRSVDIGDVAGVNTRVFGHRKALISVQRPRDSNGFDPQAKRLLALLAPHVEIAKKIQANLRQRTTEREALAGSLDRLESAAFILTTECNVYHANQAAHALLARDMLVRCVGCRLSFRAPKAHSALEAAVREATRRGGRTAVFPVVLSTMARAEVAVLPLRSDYEASQQMDCSLALVLVTPASRDARAIEWRLRELYGLTRMECRVMTALAMGKTVEEIATAHRVSETTLRSQVRSLFAKTGVSRQADLVRLALAGAQVVRES